MIDMLCTIDDHRWLLNMLVAEAHIDDKFRAEALINAVSRDQAPTDSESRADSLQSRKVHIWLYIGSFHLSFGQTDSSVSLWVVILRLRWYCFPAHFRKV
jgi:hypothetical protein